MARGIFISYRRDTGSTMARMIYDRLRLEKHFQCFLDVEKLNAGNFRQNIESEMDKCDIYLLVLSKNALNRCVNPNDNVRQEILAAIGKNLTIIPITAEDFVWPDTMPAGIEAVKDFNAIPYVQVYSEQFFERLYSFIEASRGRDNARHQGTTGKAHLSSGTASKKRGLWIVLIACAALVFMALLTAALILGAKLMKAGQKAGDASLPGGVAAVTEDAQAGSDTAQPSEAQNGQFETIERLDSTVLSPGNDQSAAATIPVGSVIEGAASDGLTWWYSFKTGSGTDFTVTAVDKTCGSSRLRVILLDADGESLNAMYVSDIGTATSFEASLEPDTEYYLRIHSNASPYWDDPSSTPIDYAFVISETDEHPSGALWEITDTPGNNQDASALIPLNTPVEGTASDKHSWWYVFRTGTNTDITVTAIDKTCGSDYLYVLLYDARGNHINSRYVNRDGTAESISEGLEPDTFYYLRIQSNASPYFDDPSSTPIDFVITVKD